MDVSSLFFASIAYKLTIYFLQYHIIGRRRPVVIRRRGDVGGVLRGSRINKRDYGKTIDNTAQYITGLY